MRMHVVIDLGRETRRKASEWKGRLYFPASKKGANRGNSSTRKGGILFSLGNLEAASLLGMGPVCPLIGRGRQRKKGNISKEGFVCLNSFRKGKKEEWGIKSDKRKSPTEKTIGGCYALNEERGKSGLSGREKEAEGKEAASCKREKERIPPKERNFSRKGGRRGGKKLMPILLA